VRTVSRTTITLLATFGDRYFALAKDFSLFSGIIARPIVVTNTRAAIHKLKSYFVFRCNRHFTSRIAKRGSFLRMPARTRATMPGEALGMAAHARP
jgi:hypothetical protein